jgi:thioredoxin-dependent peroxiredoxin
MGTFKRSRLKIAAVWLTLCGIAAIAGCDGRSEPMTEQMKERANAVTMKGKPLTLLGTELKVGDMAPDVNLVANDLSVVKLSSYRGKVCIISAVPSLDTSVCSMETRRFNVESAKLGPDIIILTVSMDLPFAQKRWCGAEGVERVITLSDYRNADFGKAYGVLIKELHLLARTVFVIDKQGVIRYIQAVKELATEPDYNAVLDAVKKI